jgi:hypothetical protein
MEEKSLSQNKGVSTRAFLRSVGILRERLAGILSREGGLGDEWEIPAGTVMVCPKNPSHYRMRLQFVGQRLRCPEHDVDLVPEESIRG